MSKISIVKTALIVTLLPWTLVGIVLMMTPNDAFWDWMMEIE